MIFTLDLNFNDTIYQFTLPCISTGGPATTVTWTRDSETVSGGMTVLDDPVTAQYTHTLTVTKKLGGQCTVVSNKPSNTSAKLDMEVLNPINNCPINYTCSLNTAIFACKTFYIKPLLMYSFPYAIACR